MKTDRRGLLLAIGTALALGMALIAQPTEFREHVADASQAAHVRWAPGTDIPMSGFNQSVTWAPMPH